MRSFVSAASRFQPRSGSRLFAQALETTVSAPFSDRVSVVCVGAKCRSEYRQCYATVITRWEPPCSASSPPPYAAQLRVGPVPYTSCADKQPRKCPCLFLQGTASPCFNLAAIPPGLVALRLRGCVTPLSYTSASLPCPAATHTAGFWPQSLPGVQEAAVPAAGAESVRHPVTGSRLAPSSQRRAARHRLRGNPASATLPCAFIRKAVPVSVEGCAPLDRFPALTPLGRPGPGRGGRLPPTAPVSSAVPGSPRAPFHGAPEPAAPTLPDRLPGHAPLRSAPLVTDGLTGGPRIDVRGNAGDFSRIDSAACETVSNQGQPGAHARTPVRHRPASHARRPEKRYIHLPKGAAADAAAGTLSLA